MQGSGRWRHLQNEKGVLLKFILWQMTQKQLQPGQDIDLVRTARMAGFGFLFYGPLQHRWYGLLASKFPGSSTPNFLSKVTCPLPVWICLAMGLAAVYKEVGNAGALSAAFVPSHGGGKLQAPWLMKHGGCGPCCRWR